MAPPARVLVVDDSPTILKVVSSILARHGYETTTARDGIAGIEVLKRGVKYDLVLLDFVMPRMNGYQFCRELRSSPAHRELPVVLMSAKGDKIRGQFVQQTGAVDAITKPFDARALVAVVEGALSKTAEGRARPVPEGRTMPEEDTVAESIRPSVAGRQLRARASVELAQQIAAAIMPSILSLTDGQTASAETITAAVADSLTMDVVRSVGVTLRDFEHAEGAKEVMSGDIAAIPLAEVMQVLQMQRQTGILRITNYRTAVTIAMRQGLIDLVQSRGASDEFKLGRYFVEKGLLTRAEVEEIVSNKGDALVGDALIAAGRITQEDLVDALEKQSSELIYDVLRWPFGRFSFCKEPFAPEVESARLGLGISGLVLEGFRRVDEWRLMEATIDFDQVVMVDQVALGAIGDDNLTRSEKRLLDAVNGSRMVSEVIKESALGSFDGIKAIYQFLQSRVIRARA